MKSPKISRSESREAAVQILYCQHFTEQDTARAVSGVQATQTIEALQDAMRTVGEARAATEAATRSMDAVIDALREAVKPPEERKLRKVDEGILPTSLNVSEGFRDAAKALRETAKLLDQKDSLFHDEGFCQRLLRTYNKHRDSIHTVLERSLEGWTLRRLTAEDSALLRLGVTELLYLEDVPPKAVINEYIELSKRYGDKDSSKLVNGVLDRVLRDNERAPAQAGADSAT